MTRLYFKTRHYVFKIPISIQGLRDNRGERRDSSKIYLCPAFFSAWFGLLNIQPRCEPVNDQQWDLAQTVYRPLGLPLTRDMFGVYKGMVVLWDFGELPI